MQLFGSMLSASGGDATDLIRKYSDCIMELEAKKRALVAETAPR